MSEAIRIGEWTQRWAAKHELDCEYAAETESTNDLAKNYYFRSDANILFVTESQSKGRGRGSHMWVNARPGSSLLSTWSFFLSAPPQPIATPLLGLAVYRSLRSALGVKNLSLKAPNDIYVDGKKAGGLLVEVVTEGRANRINIGFGLNVFAKPEIANATDISPYVSEALNEETWCVFLSVLYDEFQRAVHESHQHHLPQSAREELLVALNKNPNLSEKYTSVELNGSLRTKNSMLEWNSL